jgi:hypothetical protein
MLGTILLIILILVIVYFFLYPNFVKGKEKKSQAIQKVDTSEVFGPQIEFGPNEAVYTPYSEISNYEIEGYSIEYDTGEIPFAKLSNTVKIIFNWRNRFGFVNVKDLKFDWYVGENLIESKTFNRDNENTNKINNYFKTNFPKKATGIYNSISFNLPSDNDTVSVIGDNYVIMSYKLKDDTEYSKIFEKSDLVSLNTIINISNEDLSQTLDLKETIKQTYTPGIAKSGDDAMKVTSEIEKTGYYIIPGAEDVNNIGNETIQYLIDRTDNGRIIMNPGKDNFHVKLMVEDMSKYIKYSFSDPGRTFSFVDTYNEATDFSIVEGEKEDTIRFRLQYSGTDYFMTYENKVGTGRVLAMKSYDEVENDEYYGYDLNFLKESGNVDCQYKWEVADESDETYLSTGERKYIFKIIKPQSGDGKACMDTDGITELTYTDKDIVERKEDVDCKLSIDNTWSGCSPTCGDGTKTAEIDILQQAFNDGTTCDDATKTLLNIGQDETIYGNENDGYYRQKSCYTECKSCKVQDSFIDGVYNLYNGGWSKDNITENAVSACKTLLNENDCNQGNYDEASLWSAFGVGGGWDEVCEWK